MNESGWAVLARTPGNPLLFGIGALGSFMTSVSQDLVLRLLRRMDRRTQKHTHTKNKEWKHNTVPVGSESFSSQFDFCSSIPSIEFDLLQRDLELETKE